MKKLMVALAAVVATAGIQAAQVDWKAGYTGSANYDGGKAYLFNASNKEAVLGILSDFTTESDVLAYALKMNGNPVALIGESEFLDPTWKTTFAEDTVEGLSGTESVFAVLFQDDIKVGTDYLVSTDQAVADYVYAKGSGSPGTLNMKSSYYTTSGTIAGGGDVPEPTSAMLMLLGMAGLALRRRRA